MGWNGVRWEGRGRRKESAQEKQEIMSQQSVRLNPITTCDVKLFTALHVTTYYGVVGNGMSCNMSAGAGGPCLRFHGDIETHTTFERETRSNVVP